MNPIIEECQALHCEWIRQHPHFICSDSGLKGDDYRELVIELYKGFQQHFEMYGYVSRMSTDLLKTDIKRQRREEPLQLRLQALEKELENPLDDKMLWAFITIGFNEQTISVNSMC